MVLNTLPEEEAQVNFGYIGTLNVNGKHKKAWVFVMTLSYSRYMYIEVVLNQSVKTFIECHKNAFKYFKGVPETVKIDNISYNGNYYSIPYAYIGQEVEAIIVNDLVKIYFKEKEIALHSLWKGDKGHYTTNNEHYPNSKNISSEDILSRQREEIKEMIHCIIKCNRQKNV